MEQFHFDPDTYQELMDEEVPGYPRLQDAIATASSCVMATRILDLGTGTGVTAQRVHELHPTAQLVGIDESADMLDAARQVLPPDVELRVARLEDPLPSGPFDLVVSALAVHHLDGSGKANLFQRVSEVVAPGGRFVLGDIVVPVDPDDVVTPIDGVYDQPAVSLSSSTGSRRPDSPLRPRGANVTSRSLSGISRPLPRPLSDLLVQPRFFTSRRRAVWGS